MALSKKHFERIARDIADQRGNIVANCANDPQLSDHLRRGLYYTADKLATFFTEENPNFDRARFLRACGF